MEMNCLQFQDGDVFDDAYTADALLFPANPKAVVGGSMDRAVYQKAGCQELLDARTREAALLEPTQVCITDSFQLKPKYQYLIHAVSPKYTPDQDAIDLMKALADTYFHALAAAEQYGIRTIVTPLLGAGANAYPVKIAETAAQIGINQYFSSFPGKIRQVIVVKYRDEELARKVRECQEHLKQACFTLRDEETGMIREEIREAVIHQISSQDTQIRDYIQMLDEELFSIHLDTYVFHKNFYQEMFCQVDTDSADPYRDYCEKVYWEIVDRAMKNKDAIALFLNTEKSDLNKLVKNNLYHKRINVLRFGMAAGLHTEDFYRLMLCTGFSFPINGDEVKLLFFLNQYQNVSDPDERYALYLEMYEKLGMFQQFETKRQGRNQPEKRKKPYESEQELIK